MIEATIKNPTESGPLSLTAIDLSTLHWLAIVSASALLGVAGAWLLRRQRLAPTWTPLYLVPGVIVWQVHAQVGTHVALAYLAGAASFIGGSVKLHLRDLHTGADRAQRARELRGPSWALRHIAAKHRVSSDIAGSTKGVALGESEQTGKLAWLRLTAEQGHHLLVTGSTGSGKTVTLRRIATEAIAKGFGVVIIDAKGGVDFLGDARHAAAASGRRFIGWSFNGPWTYNAYGSGSASEIAARLLFDEITEPYYLRIFQRHLQQVVAAVQASGMTPSLRLVTRYSQGKNWGELIDRLGGDALHRFTEYIESLSPRIIQDLTGSISRLATLDESDIGRWLRGCFTERLGSVGRSPRTRG